MLENTPKEQTDHQDQTYHIRIIFLGSGHKAGNYVYGSEPYNGEDIHICEYSQVRLSNKNETKQGRAMIFSGPNRIDMFSHLTIKGIIKKAKEILPKWIQGKLDENKEQQIKINITGHSRGGIIARTVREFLVSHFNDKHFNDKQFNDKQFNDKQFNDKHLNITLNIYDEYGGPVNSRMSKWGATRKSKNNSDSITPRPQRVQPVGTLKFTTPGQKSSVGQPVKSFLNRILGNSKLKTTDKNVPNKNIADNNSLEINKQNSSAKSTTMMNKQDDSANASKIKPRANSRRLRNVLESKIQNLVLKNRAGKLSGSRKSIVENETKVKYHVISLRPERSFTNITAYSNATTVILTAASHRGTSIVVPLFKLKAGKAERPGLFFHTEQVTFTKEQTVMEQLQKLQNPQDPQNLQELQELQDSRQFDGFTQFGKFYKINNLAGLEKCLEKILTAFGNNNLASKQIIAKNKDILFGNDEKYKNIRGLKEAGENFIQKLREQFKDDATSQDNFCKLFSNGAGGARGIVVLNAMGKFIM